MHNRVRPVLGREKLRKAAEGRVKSAEVVELEERERERQRFGGSAI